MKGHFKKGAIKAKRKVLETDVCPKLRERKVRSCSLSKCKLKTLPIRDGGLSQICKCTHFTLLSYFSTIEMTIRSQDVEDFVDAIGSTPPKVAYT